MTTYHSLSEIQESIRSGDLTCRQLVSQYLERIENKSFLNIFLQPYSEEALAKADELDQKFQKGAEGRLAGMVMGLKDVLCYQDHPLQASSRILDGFVSQFSATVVHRLLEQDAIIIGRLNCDEFAMGSSNENSAFGAVKNPVNHSRVPGGSSGGAAAAVKADLCLASLGSDTGGSVRQPASFCGVIGLKPTYSRISRYGLAAYASSFDCIGIMSHSVEDSALILEVIAGSDDYDSTVSRTPVPKYSQALNFNGPARIGYIKETLDNEALNLDVKDRTLEKIDFLKSQGHVLETVEFPLLEYALPTYYVLTAAEASSNLARYDGVKYGYRSGTDDLEVMYKRSRTEGFGEEVRRRIILGTFVLSANYHDAFYSKAQKVRRLIREKTHEILSKYEFVILPTAPTPAFELGEHTQNPMEMYLADLFTVQASVAGVPSISIPNGTDTEGLPVGLQIMAKDFQEDRLLAFSKYLLDQNN